MKIFQPDRLSSVFRRLRATANYTPDENGMVTENNRFMLLNATAEGCAACEDFGLPVTKNQLLRFHSFVSHPSVPVASAVEAVRNIALVMEDECKTVLFFAVDADHKKNFENFAEGWEPAINRWPDLLTDVEEMNKCYALGRYAAAVFHAVHADETALEHVGAWLGVKDHKSGWTASANELDRIVKQLHKDRSPLHQQHFGFIEQLNGTVAALKDAWRNKVSHSQGKLVLLTVEFNDHVAEEILVASRAFVRRVATDLPH